MQSHLCVRALLFLGIVVQCNNVYADAWLEDTRESLKEGHLTSCISNISTQVNQAGINVEDASIRSYCQCLGSLNFDNFSRKDYQYLKDEGKMPPSKNNRAANAEKCADHLDF